LALLPVSAIGGARANAPEVGTAIVVRNTVTLTVADEQRPLKKGAVVHQDEVLTTGKASTAEIELKDKTKLAVGPDATIVLDNLVFDPNAPQRSIVLDIGKGAFRFITGLSPKEAYEIRTPTATMGIRGTVFDVYVSPEGETAVLLHEGAVDICATPTTCQRHDRKGQVIHVSLTRVLSFPLSWDASLFQGLAFASAFPFVGKRLVVDPVRRVASRSLTTSQRVGREILKTPGKVFRQFTRPPF
jgi:ferric-dicitrate binding protein FerR (iron transport regulator)